MNSVTALALNPKLSQRFNQENMEAVIFLDYKANIISFNRTFTELFDVFNLFKDPHTAIPKRLKNTLAKRILQRIRANGMQPICYFSNKWHQYYKVELRSYAQSQAIVFAPLIGGAAFWFPVHYYIHINLNKLFTTIRNASLRLFAKFNSKASNPRNFYKISPTVVGLGTGKGWWKSFWRNLKSSFKSATLKHNTLNLEKALHQLFRRKLKGAKPSYELIYSGSAKTIDLKYEATLYAMMEQLLKDTLSYRNIRSIKLSVQEQQDTLQFDYKVLGTGLFLQTQRNVLDKLSNRLNRLKGQLRVRNTSAEGLQIKLSIPLNSQERNHG